jgi:hypothetical protein
MNDIKLGQLAILNRIRRNPTKDLVRQPQIHGLSKWSNQRGRAASPHMRCWWRGETLIPRMERRHETEPPQSEREVANHLHQKARNVLKGLSSFLIQRVQWARRPTLFRSLNHMI